MTFNDILRRLRYTFDWNDAAVASLFESGGLAVTREQVLDWTRRDEDPELLELNAAALDAFLNGFITSRRGEREGGPPAREQQLSNNVIFRKLKIALNLQESDVLALMELAGFPLGKPELSALFRSPTHRHYRECKDQILRRFLQGVQLKYGPKSG